MIRKNKNISKKNVWRLFKNPKKKIEKEKKKDRKEEVDEIKANVTSFGCHKKRHYKSECLVLKKQEGEKKQDKKRHWRWMTLRWN